ncbi:cellulose binding domain-containing protein [Saccharothrix sp. MB29]|nr:cellulose binding domain-containing protein [Saccharothrix sp. MB29]
MSSGSGSTAVVRNAAWNGSLTSGASAVFGYLGGGAASTPTLSCTSP